MNNIIKGLQHCSTPKYTCDDCSYFKKDTDTLDCQDVLMRDALALIRKLTRNKAHWILSSFQNEEDNMNGNYHYECSNCGAGDVHSEHVHVPYCWHCGAKMEDN